MDQLKELLAAIAAGTLDPAGADLAPLGVRAIMRVHEEIILVLHDSRPLHEGSVFL